MLCVWSEAPDVKTLDITDEINRHISASIIRYRFTQNTQECLICPNSSAACLIAILSFKQLHLHLFFCVITTFKGWGFFLVFCFGIQLRLRPRFGPPTPVPSDPESPLQFSLEWPGGCPTRVPSSRRSSAAEGTGENRVRGVQDNGGKG